MYGFTRALDPQLTLSYHTQGRVIYWQYDGYDVPGSKAIAERFAAASGYAVAETPYASGHAGYKDWFLQDFRRPGFTIEAGSGENPLPLSQFPDIWSDNLGILLGGMAAICDTCDGLASESTHDKFARFSEKYVCWTVAQKAKAHRAQKTPSPYRETAFSIIAHVSLSDCGTGAVTSVRVTPLENVRLLRMVEKSLDMLR